MRSEWRKLVEMLAFLVERLHPAHAKATASLIDLWLRNVRNAMTGDVALQVAAHCAALESRGLAELVAFCGARPDETMRAAISAAEAEAKKSIESLRAQAATQGRQPRLDRLV